MNLPQHYSLFLHHLLIGPVNYMYDEISKVWPGCEQWSKRLHLKSLTETIAASSLRTFQF